LAVMEQRYGLSPQLIELTFAKLRARPDKLLLTAQAFPPSMVTLGAEQDGITRVPACAEEFPDEDMRPLCVVPFDMQVTVTTRHAVAEANDVATDLVVLVS